MGVTYKLKTEVIDLIVQKKKESPSLSCRKLKILLQETLNLNVSKSSINAVIKEYKLSSPVGRKPSKPQKVFNIPSEKKEELLAQVVPFLDPQSVVEEKKIDAVDIMPPLIEVSHENIKEEPSYEPLLLRKDPLELEYPSVTQQPPATNELLMHEKILWENAGLVFIWGMLKGLLPTNYMGSILARALSINMEKARILEAALFLHVLGVSTIDEVSGDHLNPLWQMLEIDPLEGALTLELFLSKEINQPSVKNLLEVELGVAFAKAGYFKFADLNGADIFMSADLSLIEQENILQKHTTVFNAVKQAIDQVILVCKPLVIDMLGKDIVQEKNKILTLSKEVGHIDKIELYGENKEIVWEHVFKDREPPQMVVFSDLNDQNLNYVNLNTDQKQQSYYFDDVNQRYYVQEGEWTGFDNEGLWSVLVVQKDGAVEKYLFLTNIGKDQREIEAFLKHCLAQCSWLRAGWNNRHELQAYDKKTAIVINSANNCLMQMKELFKVLEQVFLWKIGISSERAEELLSIYDLSGYVEKRRDVVLIKLIVPDNFSGHELLRLLLVKTGSGFLMDQHGRSCYLSIEI